MLTGYFISILHNMWVIYALFSALFASATALLAKIGVKNIDSNLATAIRTTVVLILVWGIAFATKATHKIKEVSSYTLLFLVLSGIATGMSWLFYFKAIQSADISRAAPIDKLSVVFTIILGALILHEPVGLKTAIGGALIAAGAILIAL